MKTKINYEFEKKKKLLETKHPYYLEDDPSYVFLDDNRQANALNRPISCNPYTKQENTKVFVLKQSKIDLVLN